MRKIVAFFILFLLLVLALSARATAPVQDWDWLLAEIAAGKTTVTLQNNIQRGDGTPLLADKRFTIVGDGHAITDCQIAGGLFTFQDTMLLGIQGLGGENGTPGLTLSGEGTMAVLSGVSQAVGAASGPNGQAGGDGILLVDDEQTIVLLGQTRVLGGVGLVSGGHGIHAVGHSSHIIIMGNAALLGKEGLGEGGSGYMGLSCASFSMEADSSASGGGGYQQGGAGVNSVPCETCAAVGSLSFSDQVMLVGGVGDVGGDALRVARVTPNENAADVTLSGTLSLFGAGGNTAGVGIRAQGASLVFLPEMTALYGGGTLQEGVHEGLSLTDCVATDDDLYVLSIPGGQVREYPAIRISNIVEIALAQKNPRWEPTSIEGGLNERELVTRAGSMKVDSGRVSNVAINGSQLKISARDGQYMKRLEFQQRFLLLPEDGILFALILSKSMDAVCVEATITALSKIASLGVTQFGYTTVAPVYVERIVDLALLLEAVDKAETKPERVIFGTVDDCIIFATGDKWDYQEDLMQEIMLPLP